MLTKSDIVTTFNEIFESEKEYKDLSIYEKIYALLVLTASSGGSIADTVMIRDKTTSTNKLVVDINGRIGINNLTLLETKLDNLLTELENKANLNETQLINQVSNAVIVNIPFEDSDTSSNFTIANRLALIVCPAITGNPVLTLQVSLNGTDWVNTSITITASEDNAKTLEADELAKISGAFGLNNAFRFISSSTITATLILRSITQ